MISDDEIRKVLQYDGIADAEEMIGASYKESVFTESMGVLNVMENNAKKNSMLRALGDTVYGDDVERYLSIAHAIGFEDVLQVPFVGHGRFDQPVAETLYVLWRGGILLKFDTSQGSRVNGGNFYYNWEPKNTDEFHQFISSGTFVGRDRKVWAGDHDCREALAFHVRELEEHGRILPVWVKRPFLWLLHHADTDDPKYDAKKINEDRIGLMPKEIQDAITPRVEGKNV